jgi:hypothetical protein
MRKPLLIALAAALPLLGLGGYAMAGGQSELAKARDATAAYHDLETAKAAGYTFELPQTAAFGGGTCIANLDDPSQGAMGVHMVNLGLLDDPSTSTPLDDTTLDPTVPEVLVYEQRNNGTLKLVALEYVVFQAAWEAEHGAGSIPSLFGVDFQPNPGTRFGLPPFFALHAWIWKPNHTSLTGIFSQWNPQVTCN